MFTFTSILVHWDPESLIIVETDALDHTLAAILLTKVNGNIYPITFHSWAFNTTKVNYNIHDKKLLAIVKAFKRWL